MLAIGGGEALMRLLHLPVGPTAPLLVLRAGHLVTAEDQRVEHAVGQRLLAQCDPPGRARGGNSFGPVPMLSRYSQITGESNSACPSSVVSAGTFISGFSGARVSFACTGLTVVGTSSMRAAILCSWATSMTLRANGEAAA